jgi:hypothetical protein
MCQPISGCADEGTCAASGRSRQELGQFLTRQSPLAFGRATLLTGGAGSPFSQYRPQSRLEGTFTWTWLAMTQKGQQQTQMFLKEMFVVGAMRGRQATCVSIGMRRHFVVALRPVKWFESQIVTNARAAQAQR